MSSINNRLRRLEDIAGAGVGCPECTNTPSEPRLGAEEEERLHREGGLHCPGCGRLTHFTFKIEVPGTSQEEYTNA